MTKRNHDRKPENTNISISIPADLVKEIDRMAVQQHRSRSNWITVVIDQKLHKPRTAA
jgi:metal-responsive CopG/Arc/MetJ family transcriptional regulator